MRALSINRFGFPLLVALITRCGGTAAISGQGVAIAISPHSTTVVIGDTTSFTATVSGAAAGQSTAVIWSVQEGTGGGAVDGSGRYTAPATPGTYHVQATSVADASKSDAATVNVVAGDPAGPTAQAGPMALISRSSPATSSGGIAEWAQDASYGGILWQFHMADIGESGWVAYDLSNIPLLQRQRILVALYLGKGDPYYQLNYRAALPGYRPEFIPDAYVLEGALTPSGPWTLLLEVGRNNNQFKSHSISFTPYTNLRFRATSAPSGCRLKMDVYNAGGGITDGIAFYGDSITANIFQSGSNGYPPEWFSKQIQASNPPFFPFIVGGGYPTTTARDAVDLIVTNSGTSFTSGLLSPLRTIFRAAKYAALIWGANDAPGPDLVDAFRSNYAQIIDALRAQGQTVIVASPTWAPDPGREAGLVQIRAALGFHLGNWTARTYAAGEYVWNQGRAYLCTTGGSSVTGPSGTGSSFGDGGSARWSYVPSLREDYAADANVIGGPDLYSLFNGHPEWLSDGLHPNSDGERQWRNAWVSWAKNTLYRP